MQAAVIYTQKENESAGFLSRVEDNWTDKTGVKPSQNGVTSVMFRRAIWGWLDKLNDTPGLLGKPWVEWRTIVIHHYVSEKSSLKLNTPLLPVLKADSTQRAELKGCLKVEGCSTSERTII